MFLDSKDVDPKLPMQADVCIVGGGAAGISLAVELAGTPLSVVLLESGGLEPEPGGEDIHRVVPGRRLALGHDPTRPLYFGGNTNHWAGNCRPLEEVDLAPREWMPHSGWPMQWSDLVPYYERAQTLSGLQNFRLYDPEVCRPQLEHPPLDVDPDVLVTRMMHICPVPSFAELHRERLESADNLRVVLHARATGLLPESGGGRIAAIEAVRRDGESFRLEADTVVLAAGGVDNALLLLDAGRSLACEPSARGLVGRFFMEHWYVDVPLGGWDRGLDLALYNWDSRAPQNVEGAAVWAQLTLSEKLTRETHVPGLSLWFLRLPRSSPSVTALRRMAASVLGRVPPEPSTDLRLLMTDPAEVPRYLWRRVAESREAPSEGHVLRVNFEQTPHRENRITSGDGRQPELLLGLTPREQEAHMRSLEIAADELGLDAARIVKQVKLMLEAGRVGFFWHHTGTTRMHADPAQGVVDAQCRVHGISNLFVSGSSVFPTEGTAAPTLTIVALALRLADELRLGTV